MHLVAGHTLCKRLGAGISKKSDADPARKFTHEKGLDHQVPVPDFLKFNLHYGGQKCPAGTPTKGNYFSVIIPQFQVQDVFLRLFPGGGQLIVL
jgi:hypothetical protein